MIRLSHIIIIILSGFLIHTALERFRLNFGWRWTTFPMAPSSLDILTIAFGQRVAGSGSTNIGDSTPILGATDVFISLEAALSTRTKNANEGGEHVAADVKRVVYDMRGTNFTTLSGNGDGESGSDPQGALQSTTGIATVDEVLKDLTFLFKLPNLSSLAIYFPTTKRKLVPNSDNKALRDEEVIFPPFSDTDVHLQTEVLRLYADIFGRVTHDNSRSHMLLKPQTLEIHGLLPRSNDALTSASLESAFKGLTHLLISVYPGKHANGQQHAGFNGDEARFLRDLTDLLKSTTNLESLAYAGDMDNGYVGERWRLWEGLTFPRLKALSFRYVVFDTTRRSTKYSVGFILRHKDTLMSLRMENCFVNNLMVGSWSRIFGALRKAFSGSLDGSGSGSGLTEFTFVPQPGTREEDGAFPENYDCYGWFLDGRESLLLTMMRSCLRLETRRKR